VFTDLRAQAQLIDLYHSLNLASQDGSSQFVGDGRDR
jgi:hypothetical protein